MKKTKILYWVFTGLFAALMLFTSVPDILKVPEAVTFMTTLGYPEYLIRFLGVAKLLGVIAILIPGYPRIKEWAYAGLFIDLVGATYSNLSVLPISSSLFMLLPLALGALSYMFNHKKIKQQQQEPVRQDTVKTFSTDPVFQ
ncbi:MAG TPA: DoxX family protein [Chitinophagaceae bacterium]|nr:DoxX family protein [Chitinophagaceae bacterium]